VDKILTENQVRLAPDTRQKDEPTSNSKITVSPKVASSKEGSGKTQLKNTLVENKDAVKRVEELLKAGISKLEIEKMMTGGKRVKACLLFPESSSPEAAYKSLVREEKK
jgi:hypothetical protein